MRNLTATTIYVSLLAASWVRLKGPTTVIAPPDPDSTTKDSRRAS